jgi:hypothetical protein
MASIIKKSILTSIGCLSLCFSVNSQHLEKPDTYSYLQASGGLNLSSVYVNDYGFHYSPGKNFGLSFGHKFATPLFIDGGIGYIEKGYALGSSKGSVNTMEGSAFRFVEVLNYMSLPIGVGVEFGNKVKVRFQQRASLDMLVNAHAEFDGGQFLVIDAYTAPQTDDTQNIYPYGDKFKRFDLALATSAGIKVPFGHFYLGSDLQANLGLVSVIRNEFATHRQKMIVFSGNLNFGYQF